MPVCPFCGGEVSADIQIPSWLVNLARQPAVAESPPSYPQTDPAVFATYAFVASRSAGADPAGTSALSSGPCPTSPRQLPTTTSVSVATAASPDDRSPYKSPSTSTAFALLAHGTSNCPRLIFIV